MQIGMDAILANLREVNRRITEAADLSGRRRDDVRLVVVSKGQPVQVVEAAIHAGVKDFGENYPEESQPKILAFHGYDVTWHMIGHLQSRKAGLVVEHFHFFQALDSLRLAQKLQRILVERQKTLPVLLEVNVGDEAAKYGWRIGENQTWEALEADIREITRLERLQIHGLMTMPPYGLDLEVVRPYFSLLRQLRDRLVLKFPNINWQELSMGTSADYEVAVQEGATMVRVGQAILGPRLTVKETGG